jgi:hypothetical protein
MCCHLFPQEELLNSSQAFEEYQKIYDEMNRAFSEDDYRTYRRNYFSDNDLQLYLTQLFQLQDLLPKIDGHHELKLDNYLHSGNWFFKIGFARQSIDSYKAFFAHYRQYEKELSPEAIKGYVEMRIYANSLLAENYSRLQHLDSAKQALLTNLKFTETLSGIYYPSSLNNYGLFFYWSKKDRAQALDYFNKAYKITLDSFPNHQLIGSIRDNIADIYSDNGLYAEALPLYKKNFWFYQYTPQERSERMDYPRLISAGAQLASTYIALDSLRNANIILDSLQNYLVNHLVDYSAQSRLEIEKTKGKLLFKENKLIEAHIKAQEVLALSDSIHQASRDDEIKWRSQLNNIIMDRVELNSKLERLQQENKIKSQRLKLWLAILTFSTVVILLASLFLRRRQHIINAKNKQLIAEKTLENTALKVEQLRSEIKSKERDLSDFALNLSQNKEWTELLAHKIEALKSANLAEKDQLLEDMEMEIQNKIAFDKNTSDFFERVDKLNDSFYTKLIELFPNLSKNEIRLCSLIRLRIDSRSVATLQNITITSLNTSRYRLRKKLQLSEDVDLDAFIQNI